MKKVIKLLVFVISLFISVDFVKADKTCEDIVMYANSDFWSKTGVSMNFAGKNKNFSLYTLKDSSGISFSSYCRNAGITSGQKYGSEYICQQVVFDTSTNDETQKTYDAGIIEILKNGYSTRNNHSTPLATNQEYTATNLALRTYEMLWKDISTNGYDVPRNNAHKYYANKWLDDAEIINLLKQSAGKVREKYTDALKVTSWTLVDSGVNVTAKIENEARRLVILGLKAAVEYKKNGAATLKWNDKPKIQKSPTISDANGVKKYETTLTYVFTASKFKSDGAYINMDFSCPQCTTHGVDYNIYINNEDVGKTISGNLLPETGNGKIVLKIVFKSDSTKYHYGEIPYTLKVKYYDETISVEAYNMYSSGCSSNSNCQQFYMLYAKDVIQEEKIEGVVELNTLNCTELENLCVNENDLHACDIWDEIYNKTCVECQAYVSNAACSNTESKISVKEGYDYDSKTCTGSKDANVLQCIIGQSDKNGNTYQATNLANNKYCSVWCKEDYHFTLPGNKETNSGRYFTLQASIKGAKTCYTSEIDKTTFESDYEIARKEVIEAYNNWALYNAAVNNNSNTWTFDAYDSDGTSLSSISNLTYDRTNATCIIYGQKVSCTYGSNATKYKASDVTSKASTLNAKINSLNTILKSYNSCSSWTMSYNFEPEIHFWYEESYMNEVNTDILATEGSANTSSVKVQRCSTNVSDESYNQCSTGWTTNSLLKDENKFLCYKDGKSYKCSTQTIKVGQTIRMKEYIEATGSYITPTQFYTIYPSGAIAVASPGASIENATELTNKLPVGLRTTQGVYNYVLMVENLGEYYNSDELGRIWGAEDSVVSTTLKENSKCQANGALKYEVNIDGKNYFGDGVYNCAYKVNCPDCPIECEPDGCENPDCPDNNCPVDCDNCVYTNSNTDVNYRPITPDDLNPNDRELGKNWEFNDKNIKTGLELKAYATTKEIEDLGETIYDINFENPGVDEEYAMKVNMDSAMISKIRAYNDKYEDTYGYLNNSLKCYDYKNSADGKTYKNIFCYSELLDELLTDSDTKNNIKITVDRPTSEAERKNYNPTNGYFTTWTLANSSKWNIKTAYGFSINNTKKGYGTDVNIGPSWK